MKQKQVPGQLQTNEEQRWVEALEWTQVQYALVERVLYSFGAPPEWPVMHVERTSKEREGRNREGTYVKSSKIFTRLSSKHLRPLSAFRQLRRRLLLRCYSLLVSNSVRFGKGEKR